MATGRLVSAKSMRDSAADGSDGDAVAVEDGLGGRGGCFEVLCGEGFTPNLLRSRLGSVKSTGTRRRRRRRQKIREGLEAADATTTGSRYGELLGACRCRGQFRRATPVLRCRRLSLCQFWAHPTLGTAARITRPLPRRDVLTFNTQTCASF